MGLDYRHAYLTVVKDLFERQGESAVGAPACLWRLVEGQVPAPPETFIGSVALVNQ